MALHYSPQLFDVNTNSQLKMLNFMESTSFFDKSCGQQTAKFFNGFPQPFGFDDRANILEARSAPTSNSELFTNGIFASTNGIPSFGLSNGLRKTHDVTAISNGYVDYQVIPRNGIHGTEEREPSPELTVGHGRPKSSPRQQKRSGSDFENGENLSYGLFPFTPETSDKLKQIETPRHGVTSERQGTADVINSQVLSGLNSSFAFRLGGKEGIADPIPRRWSDVSLERYSSKSPPLHGKAPGYLQRASVRSHSESEVVSSGSNLNGRQQILRRNVPEGSLGSQPKLGDLQESILQLLQMHEPLAPLQIVEALGRGTRDEIHQALCALHTKERVKAFQTNGTTVWALISQPTCDWRASPGVIGGERNKKFFGRGSFEELYGLPRRNFSVLGYDNRPRKAPRAIDGQKVWLRSNGHSPTPVEKNSWTYCRLCKFSFASESQYEEHLRTTKHQNKVAKFSPTSYKKYCEFCNVNLNSESQANEHFNSARHEQTVAKSQKAPPQQHLPLIKAPKEFFMEQFTSTQPFNYQLELYSKAMLTNGVCFLPTGTGKTLVAAQIIAHMLKLNPSRQVVFLVDRVLLVLQQSDYLRKELGHIRVADERGSFESTRSIRIGAVCGEMRKLEGNARIYEQDVLIITADCYRNHLNNGTLRFDDVSLIVLDEAHHCNKDHPYNVIIRDFYLQEDVHLGHRPKILGLTASPAGETSLEKTTRRLQRLLGNLGEAELLVVTRNGLELEEKTNRATPDCISASYTTQESNLLEILVKYVTKAFNLTVRLSDMKDFKDIFQPSSGGPFSFDDIYPVLGVIDNILLSQPESNALNALLHFQLLCEAVCTLQECGEQIALYQMTELAQEACPHGFHWAESMGLPCGEVRAYLERYLRQGFPSIIECRNSGAERLMEQLVRINWTGVIGRSSCLALVLVKRQHTARCLSEYLSNQGELISRGVRTTFINAGRSADKGLTYPLEIDPVAQTREGKFQIVVTTSLAEEGLDLPEPQWVFHMDPSSPVQALREIRGRAPLNGSRFVAICRNNEQTKKIDDLLKREENMKRSSKLIISNL